MWILPKCLVCVSTGDNSMECFEMPRIEENGEIVYKGCISMPLTIIKNGARDAAEYSEWIEKTKPPG